MTHEVDPWSQPSVTAKQPKRQEDYQVPQEYASPTLAPPSNSDYEYTRECRRGECNLDMGFYLICGECGWLIDTCEPYWISGSNHRCYHSCCASDKFAVEAIVDSQLHQNL